MDLIRFYLNLLMPASTAIGEGWRQREIVTGPPCGAMISDAEFLAPQGLVKLGPTVCYNVHPVTSEVCLPKGAEKKRTRDAQKRGKFHFATW